MSGLLLVVNLSIIHLNYLPTPLTWSPQKSFGTAPSAPKVPDLLALTLKNVS
jgi:hypothetical protein